MEISFQHTNPAASHESTLLTVTHEDDGPYHFLIDAGEDVSPHAFIGADESLDGVFLTHAHTDHYKRLSQALSTGTDVPLFTSPATAAILEEVYTEADRYQDLGDIDPISRSLQPLDSWTNLNEYIDVLPIPAGHTPGAASFLFRVDDLHQNNETVTVLATGDFTTRPVGGYPGLAIPDSVSIDILIANAATNAEFSENLSAAVRTILERGLNGATTLVASSALTGVHLAYLLGNLVDTIDRHLPISLVGQTAKLYTALDYVVPGVTTYSTFDRTDDVLDPGAVTIGGPEAPSQGSISRLFGVIEDDPDAVFVQLTTSDATIVEGATCATHNFELSNHPTEDEFVDFVEEHLPRHLIMKHIRAEEAKSLCSSLDNLFYWANDDTRSHIVYDDGSWPSPSWIDDSNASRIRRRNYQKSDRRTILDHSLENLPTVSWERQSLPLQAEGLDMVGLTEEFEAVSPQQPESHPDAQPSTKEASLTEPDAEEVGSPSSEAKGSDPEQIQQPQVDEDFQDEVIERLDELESSVSNIRADTVSGETHESDVDTIKTRLSDIETSLDTLPEKIIEENHTSITGTVLRQNNLVMLRLDEDDLAEIDLDLTHDQQIELLISTEQRPGE